MKKVFLLFRLPFTDRLLLIEAFVLLGIWRALVLLFPFKKLAPYVTRSVNDKHFTTIRTTARVGWAVETAGRHTPWLSTCLVQAIAAKIMLRRRGITSTLVMGVSSTEDKGLRAHAWLESGDRILTGAGVRKEYRPIASYS